MRIFKFGGASVKNAEAIRNLQYILSSQESGILFVVVSALGKTTNKLEVLAKHGYDGLVHEEMLQEVKDDHIRIAEELLGKIPETITDLFRSLEVAVQTQSDSWYQHYDHVVSYGELLSTTLIFQFLNRSVEIEWLDARDFIKTNDDFTRAKVDLIDTETNISHLRSTTKTFITQGFIGRSGNGHTTTLGREGSDYSAALFAKFLHADELVVWKDVPGIMSADPKLSTEVKQYRRLSYRRAVEMTYYGAKVIHPKTMAPLAESNIPMTVRSFLEPDQNGTLIAADDDEWKEDVLPTTVFRYNQVLISLRIPDISTIDHLLMSEVMKNLSQLDIQINLMQHSALSFSFCLDEDKIQMEKVREMLSSKYALLENHGLRLVTFMNYEKGIERIIPEKSEVLLEQRTRHHYRVLYRP